VRNGAGEEVPPHLRDAHYQGAASLGHGDGYLYPHDDPRGWVEQVYLPRDLEGARYYDPRGGHGAEADVARRMSELRLPRESGTDPLA
jgi:putative ATPase